MTNTTAPRYVLDAAWGQPPKGWTTWHTVFGVAVDSRDRIYLLTGGPSPIVIYNTAGKMISAWGPEAVKGGHGIYLNREADGEYLYIASAWEHYVGKYTLDGRAIWTMGTPGQPGAYNEPFNQPANFTLTPEGDFYIADGYTNRRVHHYDASCRLIRSWGEQGTGPGQFDLVHDVCFDTRGRRRRLWVCDRLNGRLQIFTPDGQFVEEKTGFSDPVCTWIDALGNMYLIEMGRGLVSVLDADDNVIGQFGEHGKGPGQFEAGHDIARDSQGALYVTEVTEAGRVQKFVPASS